jgi:hypothetical protein
MAAYISIQKALARILISFFFAIAVGLLTWFALRGPRLGPYYDLLLRFLKSAPLSAEILLIESRNPPPGPAGKSSAWGEVFYQTAGNGISGEDAGADIIEPALAASVLMTLAEFNASTLVIQTPILGAASPLSFQASAGSLWEEGLLVRFNDEFTLVNRNIRNLFDAIRTGSVAPAEAEQFVGELVNLTDRGKDRLLAALARGDAGGIGPLEQAAAVFGNVWIPGDLRLSVLGAGGREPFPIPNLTFPALFGPPGGRYFRPHPDWDGRVRRIAPVIDPGEAHMEHVVYAALKDRIRRPAGESGGWMDAEFPLPLDSKGNVLFIPPGAGQTFRRLSLEDFQKYEEADQELYRILKEAEGLGLFREMEGESYPSYRYEYAQDIRRELLENPAPEQRARWIRERERYFRSLDEFFAGPGRANLIMGYDELIDRESLEEDGRQQVISMRGEVIRIFQELWEKYTALLNLRSGLAVSLAGAFCVLGSPAAEAGGLETSAFLANSFLTGKAVRPASDRDGLLAFILSSFLVLCILAPAGPWATLGAGLALTAGVLGIFSYSFIHSAFWIDPLIPAVAVLAGVLSSFAFALVAKNRAVCRFRSAYGPHIAPVYLRRLIKAYHPLPTETLSAKAAIVAVRDQELKGIESRSSPGESAAAALIFRKEILNIFGREGGVTVGMEGDLMMIALGSPLERTAIRNMKTRIPYDDGPKPSLRTPAAKALAIVRDITGHIPQATNWRFAVDTGDCTFSYSEAAGYTAYGRPMACARLFSGLAVRYKARVLVTARITEQNPELRIRKLGDLVESSGEIREGFYEALFSDAAGKDTRTNDG